MSLQSARTLTRTHVTLCAGLIPLRSAFVMSSRWTAVQRLGGRSEASRKTSARCWETQQTVLEVPVGRLSIELSAHQMEYKSPISFAAIMIISHKIWMRPVEKNAED